MAAHACVPLRNQLCIDSCKKRALHLQLMMILRTLLVKDERLVMLFLAFGPLVNVRREPSVG